MAQIIACSSANMRRAITVHMTACSTNIDLNALLRPQGGEPLVPMKKEHTQRRLDRPASAGADVAGDLEGIADDTAHSVREWSGPAAAGWVTNSIGAICAMDGGGTSNAKDE